MTGRILVAFDGTASARSALEEAVSTAMRNHSTLTIVYVVRPVSTLVHLGGAGPTSVVQADAHREATRAIRELSRWMPADVPYTTLIRFGRPSVEILAVLDERPFDVVFVGGSRRRRLSRSLAQRIAARSSVEIRVAREPRFTDFALEVRHALGAHSV
jgi:nucleotide-binding universal stress UspA family protein